MSTRRQLAVSEAQQITFIWIDWWITCCEWRRFFDEWRSWRWS